MYGKQKAIGLFNLFELFKELTLVAQYFKHGRDEMCYVVSHEWDSSTSCFLLTQGGMGWTGHGARTGSPDAEESVSVHMCL